MADLTSLAFDFQVGDQSLTGKATYKLSDGLKAQVSVRSADRGVAVTLTGKSFEVAHDLQKEDTRFKWKTKVPGGASLTVRQFVPGGKWALVPTPEFELSRTGLLGKHGKLVAGYDYMNRVGAAEQTIYAGDDKQHKAQLKLTSLGGATATIRSKLGVGPLLHSAAARYSQKGGLQLSAKSRFGDGTKVKSTYDLASDTLTVAAKHALQDQEQCSALTLKMVIPVKAAEDPRITLGVKWDFE